MTPTPDVPYRPPQARGVKQGRISRDTPSAAQPEIRPRGTLCLASYFAARRRSELRTTNTDEQAMAALASMGESRPAIASGTINTL